jgi:hypothetical protein
LFLCRDSLYLLRMSLSASPRSAAAVSAPTDTGEEVRHRAAPPPVIPPRSFAEVIALWPSAAELAEVLDVEAVTVRAWRKRGIPARYWTAVARAARFSSRPVDERLLAEIASIRRSRTHG